MAQKESLNQNQKETLIDIPEADQWRIIRESGILQKVDSNSTKQQTTATKEEEEQLLSPFWEEFFAATSLIIPHCFLLLMMEM